MHYKAHIIVFGAAINVSSNADMQGTEKVAVIQVKRGIGDVIWHLPFIQAIAAASPGGQVTFLAPPSSCAEQLLAADPGNKDRIQALEILSLDDGKVIPLPCVLGPGAPSNEKSEQG